MADYRVKLKPSAQKELDRLSGKLMERLFARVESLTANPRPPGCKKLKGGDEEWRIRVGDYRVVYTIDDAKLLVTARVLTTQSAATAAHSRSPTRS